MNIKPEYSTILSTVPATDAVGTYTAATLLSHRNLELKNIRIKDGETLVLAGMINEEEQKTIGKVPVLGDLPVVGTLFRTTTSEKKKNEMVIMITILMGDNIDARKQYIIENADFNKNNIE